MRKIMCTIGIVALAAGAAWSEEERKSTAELEDAFEGEAPQETRRDSSTKIFPLVKHEREGDESELKILHAPGVALFKSEDEGDESKVEVVDVPFFKLVQTEHHDDGRFDNKFIKLPLVGSVFRHYKTSKKEKVRFLIFSHTKYHDEDDRPERETDADFGRSRGKGGVRH